MGAAAVVAADALGGAASSQSQEAVAQQQNAIRLAQATPQEIANLEQAVAANTKDLQRREQLIASADPSLLEIGKQTLAMLRGDKEALGSTALAKNRAKQRAELEANLKARLGTGYATSSAGIQALREFESQSADLQEANRMNVINSYLPTLAGISSNGIQANIGNAATLGGMMGNIQGRQVNASTGTAAPVIQTAGSDFVRQYQQAGAAQDIGSSIFGAMSGNPSSFAKKTF